MIRRAFCLPLLVLAFQGSCAAYRPVPAPNNMLQHEREQARRSMGRLDLTSAPETSDFMEKYKEIYRLQFESITHQHYWGTFESNKYTLVAQIFEPEDPRGTVFIAHGYMDHTGTMHHLIRDCLIHGYTVAAYDLPGHGLSSGSYASIDSFSDYEKVFADFVDMSTSQCPAPHFLVSHSTGSAIALEYLAKHAASPFAKTILVAPLIRHAYWYPVKFFFRLGQIMRFKSIGRRYPPDSGDKDFLEFRKSDPLAFKRVPAQWIAALYDWEKKLQKTDLMSCPDLVIQGDADSVVDEPYNVKCLQKMCPDIRIQWVKKGRHYLLNESLELRTKVLAVIASDLEENYHKQPFPDSTQ